MAMPTHGYLALLLLLVLATDAATGQEADGELGDAETRTWTSRDGEHTTQAVFTGFRSGKVRLRKADGTTVVVPLANLSVEDGEYVRRIAHDDPEAVVLLMERSAELEKDGDGRVIAAHFPPRWRIIRRDIQLLGSLPNLERLSLAQARLPADVYVELTNLQGLRQLDLTATETGNPQVRQLTDLKQLESLNLSDTQITNRALSYMKEFPNLSDLAVANTRLGDNGIAYLEEVQTLKKLNLGNIRATPQGIARLRKALPNAALEGSSTFRGR